MEGAYRTEVTPGSVTLMGTSACAPWWHGPMGFVKTRFPDPHWIAGNRYDAWSAKAAGPSPVADLRLMMQALLADRFGLTLHRAT